MADGDPRSAAPGKAGVSAASVWSRALGQVRQMQAEPFVSLPQHVDIWARARGAAPAIEAAEGTLSYAGLAAAKTRLARWARAQGIGRGDVVALFMTNTLHYMAVWLGLIEAGARVALVNTNLRQDALRHALQVAGTTHVITEDALQDALMAVTAQLSIPASCWILAGVLPRRLRAPGAAPAVRAPRADAAASEVSPAETALYIYTSGTTGMPKAVRITHRRLNEWAGWFAGMMQVQPQDRLYLCLPLYHSTGGVAFMGAMLAGGGTVVLRKRFSARGFWQDVAATRCTIFAYIGELCRYLAAMPAESAAGHSLRLCCGNGLSAGVWDVFRQRFAIPQILEFYASTEGTVSLYNVEQRAGAVGRIPPFLAHRFEVAIVACDADTGEILRDASGRAIRCAPGEGGEAIGRLPAGAGATGHGFAGYTDAAATAAKILRHVFSEGDSWFRTGDMMRRDSEGFFYFLDRLGDTFRWKGENVSTQEVAAALRGCAGVLDAVAYGVRVPGEEGRAGMAAIVPGPDFDPARLAREVAARLPAYARPRYVRLCRALETTGTFKPVTAILRQEGYDPARVADPVYALGGDGSYARLEEPAYA